MVELEQHKPMNMTERKLLFESQANKVKENTIMVRRQFISSGNRRIKRSKLPEIEKTAPKPNIPMGAMVEIEENDMRPTKRDKAPSYPTNRHSPVLPHDFKEVILSMGGYDLVMVLQKKLFKCDVDNGQGRITMLVRECEKCLSLTEEEKQMLKVRDEKRSFMDIRVKVIEPSFQDSKLTFKKWNYTETSSNYILMNNWFEVVVKNGLRDEDDIQICSFRIDGKLAFALVKLPGKNSSFQKT